MMPSNSTDNQLCSPRWIDHDGFFQKTRPVVKNANTKRTRELKRSKSLPTSLSTNTRIPTSKKKKSLGQKATNPKEDQSRFFYSEARRYPSNYPHFPFNERITCNRYLIPRKSTAEIYRFSSYREEPFLVDEDEDDSKPLRGLAFIDDKE